MDEIALRFRNNVTAASKIMKACGITKFCVAFHQSGLGDQFLTAMVTSKLCGMIELQFAGVVAETVAYRNRIDDLFDNESKTGWFHEIFGRTVPMVSSSECILIKIGGKKPAGLIQSILKCGLEKSSKSILVLQISAQDAAANIAHLEDGYGNCLENPFYRAYQANLPAPAVAPAGKKRILFHVRLGDITPLAGLREGYYVLPAQSAIGEIDFELVNIDDYPRHSRNSGLDYLAEMARRLKETVGDRVEFALISDGAARPLDLLNRDSIQARLREEFGLSDVASYLEEVSASYRHQFEALERYPIKLNRFPRGNPRKAWTSAIHLDRIPL